MDSRSSLSFIESEDTTLLALSQDIDVHTAQLRNSVLQSIAGIRAKIHAQTAEMLAQQAQLSQLTEQRLLLQIESLQEVAEARGNESEFLRSRVEKLLQLQYFRSKRRLDQATLRTALRAWHRLVSAQKALAKKSDAVARQKQLRDARNIFHAWRLSSLRSKLEQRMERTLGEHRRAMAKASHDHQAAESASRIEILSLREKLAVEEERRGILEEKLKAAFMRGVCALNLEAMQVLRSTNDAQLGDMSVATLLQNMNAALGVAPQSVATGTDGSALRGDGAADPNSAVERLVQRQAELHEQLSAVQEGQQQLQQGHAQPQRPATGSSVTPSVHMIESHREHVPQPTAFSTAAATASRAPFTVNVNPSFKRAKQTVASLPPKTVSSSGAGRR